MEDPISFANDSKKEANSIMKKITHVKTSVPLIGLYAGPNGLLKGNQILYDYKDKPSNLFWRSKVKNDVFLLFRN